MIVQDLITDAAIEIVFRNTNFGSTTPREIIAEDLKKIEEGWAIGHTSQCCLVELGLAKLQNGNSKIVITSIGKTYLNLLAQDEIYINALDPIVSIMNERGTILVTTKGTTYRYFPYWLEQLEGDDKVRIVSLNNIPDDLKEHVDKLRN